MLFRSGGGGLRLPRLAGGGRSRCGRHGLRSRRRSHDRRRSRARCRRRGRRSRFRRGAQQPKASHGDAYKKQSDRTRYHVDQRISCGRLSCGLRCRRSGLRSCDRGRRRARRLLGSGCGRRRRFGRGGCSARLGHRSRWRRRRRRGRLAGYRPSDLAARGPQLSSRRGSGSDCLGSPLLMRCGFNLLVILQLAQQLGARGIALARALASAFRMISLTRGGTSGLSSSGAHGISSTILRRSVWSSAALKGLCPLTIW